MGDAGKNETVEVAKDVVERPASLRRRARQQRAELAWGDASEDRQLLDPLPVIGHPLGYAAGGGPELLVLVGALMASSGPKLLVLVGAQMASSGHWYRA